MANERPVATRPVEVLLASPSPAPNLLALSDQYPALAAATRGEPFWDRVFGRAWADTWNRIKKNWLGATGISAGGLAIAYALAWYFRGFDAIKENAVWLAFVIGGLLATSVVYFVARVIQIPAEMEREVLHDAAALATALRGEVHVRDEQIADLTARDRDRPRLMVTKGHCFGPAIRPPHQTPPIRWRTGATWTYPAIAHLAITNDPEHPTREAEPLITATLTFTAEGDKPLTIEGGWIKADVRRGDSLPPLTEGGMRIAIGQTRALAVALRYPNVSEAPGAFPPCWALNANSCQHDNWINLAPGWTLVGTKILVEVRLHGVEINERRRFHLNSKEMSLDEIDCDVTATAVSSETR